MKRLMILGLLAPAIGLAQLQVRDRTPGGELTGYFWMDLTKDGRINFLFGFRAGYGSAEPSVTGEARREWEESNPVPDGTYGEVVEEIDRFFAAAENRPIPVTAAMKIIKMKKEGLPQSEIDQRLERYREVFVKRVREACEYGQSLSAEECRARGYPYKSKSRP